MVWVKSGWPAKNTGRVTVNPFLFQVKKIGFMSGIFLGQVGNFWPALPCLPKIKVMLAKAWPLAVYKKVKQNNYNIFLLRNVDNDENNNKPIAK